ncbi:MAG: outer membrane beta-barrel protein [Terriglobales bacterium]
MQRLHPVLSLLTFLFMIVGAASAQVPTKGNVFFGYSLDRTPIVSNDTVNTNGWDATLEGKLLPWIGVVVDFDGHYGSDNFNGVTADVNTHNVLFGPRVSVQIQRLRPFAEVLVGVSHITRSNGISDSNTSFSNAAGGGFDYKIFGPVAFRAQLDWINTRFYGNGQNGVRVSTGIAVHF